MRKNDIIYIQATAIKGARVFLDIGPNPFEEAYALLGQAIIREIHKDDEGFNLRVQFDPFDDAIDPATGLNRKALEESYKRNAGMNPLPNESREAYVARLIEYEGQTQSRAEGWADAFGFVDDGMKAKWDSDPQAQRWFNHQTPKAWASLTPGEQSELKRHMDLHWTGSRFWDGIHRFD